MKSIAQIWKILWRRRFGEMEMVCDWPDHLGERQEVKLLQIKVQIMRKNYKM